MFNVGLVCNRKKLHKITKEMFWGGVNFFCLCRRLHWQLREKICVWFGVCEYLLSDVDGFIEVSTRHLNSVTVNLLKQVYQIVAFTQSLRRMPTSLGVG
jgi:hypothetical protein